ncbi:MAG: hypothetical protein WBB57_04200, partial [Mycobacterium sp.]
MAKRSLPTGIHQNWSLRHMDNLVAQFCVICVDVATQFVHRFDTEGARRSPRQHVGCARCRINNELSRHVVISSR